MAILFGVTKKASNNRNPKGCLFRYVARVFAADTQRLDAFANR
ncbi:hypothetical protein [Spirosoma aerophilum]